MQSRINENSAYSTKSELDLFTVPPTQVVTKNSQWEVVKLQNPCTDQGPYTFSVPSGPHYLDLKKNYLHIKLQILHANEQNVVAGDPRVVLINDIGSTLFAMMKIFVGRKLIESCDLYHYRAYIEDLLNYGNDAVLSQLQTRHFFPDTAGQMNETADVNTGATKRRNFFLAGQTVSIIAPLHASLFNQEKLFLSRAQIGIELERNLDAFVLLSPQQPADGNAPVAYKTKVKDMTFYVRKVELEDSVAIGIEHTLLSFAAKYPVRRSLVKSIHIAAAGRSSPNNTLFTGPLPNRVILGLIATGAYHGTLDSNPLNFSHNNVSRVKVIAGGTTYPSHPLTFDYGNGAYQQGYYGLYDALGLIDDNKGLCFSMTDYPNGYCLYGIALGNDGEDSNYWNPIKDGSLSVDLEFSQNVPDGGLELIVYAEFDGLISITHERNVLLDYAP